MPRVQEFFDPLTYTLSYLVYDSNSRDAVLIDPVYDYDPAASVVTRGSIEKVQSFIEEARLTLRMILETHAHADHISSSQEWKKISPGAPLGIGAGIRTVQELFKEVYNLDEGFPTDGRQFDRLFVDGERVEAGALAFEVRATPGHTPACVSYVFEDAVFVGDALFMPDYGTGRCDFPGGSAERLFHSIQERIYTLPPDTQVYTGHDYLPQGRPLRFAASVEEQKRSNIHIRAETPLDTFTLFRQERDKGLSTPRLLYPSVQINIDAGRLPSVHTAAEPFLKIPIFRAETSS